MAELRTTLERFCGAGFSKFVVVPLEDPPSWADELAEVGDAVLQLITAAVTPVLPTPVTESGPTTLRLRHVSPVVPSLGLVVS